MYTYTQAMEDANMKKSEIDEIVLVGGSTRIPKVQALLKEYFDVSVGHTWGGRRGSVTRCGWGGMGFGGDARCLGSGWGVGEGVCLGGQGGRRRCRRCKASLCKEDGQLE